MAILLFGFAMMIMAGANWYWELKPFLENRYYPVYSKFIIVELFQRLGSLFITIYRFVTLGKYFMVDMFVTIFSVSVLGFGEGVSGGIMGLGFSNVVSVLIIFIMWKDQKRLARNINVVTS